MANLIRCPSNIDIPYKAKRWIGHWVWTLSAHGKIKVNMDGSFLGGFDRGALGVFSETRETIFLFSSGRRLMSIQRFTRNCWHCERVF